MCKIANIKQEKSTLIFCEESECYFNQEGVCFEDIYPYPNDFEIDNSFECQLS